MHKTGDNAIFTSEVAKILRCDVRTVHRMVRKGRLIPTAKTPGLRGAYLFSRSDVAALLEDLDREALPA